MSGLPILPSDEQIRPQEATNVQSTWDDVAGELQRFSSQAMQMRAPIVAQQQELAGQTAARNPNSPIPGVGGTMAARSFEQGYMDERQVTIDNQIRMAYGNLRNQILMNPSMNSLQDFQEGAQKIKEQISPLIPAQLQTKMENSFDQYNESNSLVVGKRVNSIARNINGYQTMSTLNDLNNTLKTNVFAGNLDAAKQVVQKMGQLINSGVSTGVLPARTAAAVSKGIQMGYNKSFYLGQFAKQLQNGHGEDYINSFSNSKDPNVDPLQRMTIAASMQGMLKQHNLAQEQQGYSVENDIKSTVANVKAGAISQQDLITKIADWSNHYPAQYAKAVPDIEAAQGEYEITNALKGMTPTQAQSFIQQIKPQPGGANYATQLTMFNTAVKAYTQQRKIALKDPVPFVQTFPAVTQAMQQNKLAPTDANGNKVQAPGQPSIDVNQAVLDTETAQGLPHRLLSNADASSFVQQAMTMPVSDQLTMLNQKLAAYNTPEQKSVVLNDLARFKLPLASKLGYAMQFNEQSKPYLNDFSQAMAIPDKDVMSALNTTNTGASTKFSAIQNAVGQKLNPFINGLYASNVSNPQDVASLSHTVTKFAAYLMAKGQSQSDAIQTATDALVNDQYSTQTIFGKPLNIPRYIQQTNKIVPMNVEQVQPAADYLRNQIQSSNNLFVPNTYRQSYSMDHPNANESDIMSSYKQYLFSSVYPGVTPDGQSMQLLDQGMPIKTADGKNFSASFSEINDPSSSFSIMEEHTKPHFNKSQEVETQSTNLQNSGVGALGL